MHSLRRIPGILALFLLSATGVAAETSQCPPNGWAEGLPAYLQTDAPFPVKDTAVIKGQKPGQNDAYEWKFPEDCLFHQWSWEAFVWATNIYWQYPPDQKGDFVRQPRFLAMKTTADLVDDQLKAREGLYLLPRDQKPEPEIDELRQAGSDGILIDQQHQPVYYSVHMNDSYFNFVQKYYGKTAYKTASPTLDFPVGAAVFKAAWKVVSENERDDWYTTSATIPTLKVNFKGRIVINSKKTRSVTVALVALHVVGRTENHPEFIWASFEHQKNSPVLPEGMSYNAPQPVSSHDYTFYKANTPAADCNVLPKKVHIKKGKLSPVTQVYRQFPRGGLIGLSTTAFDAINSQSQGQMRALARKQQPATPAYPENTVWANYMAIGTVWQPVDKNVTYPNPIPPTVTPGEGKLFKSATGSIQLQDSVLETFVQGPQNNGGSPSNCFMCHNTASYTPHGKKKPLYPGKNINLSHVILGPFFK